jgi:3-oxoacyl-[acyl-carrier-protein] synthase-3
MGDGAAALVLGPDDGVSRQCLSHAFFGQSGRGLRPGLRLVGGGSDAPAQRRVLPEFLHEFALVREHGVELFELGAAAARSIDADPRDVTYVIPHQANGRMAELLAPLLGVSPRRVFVNANRLGNTGSAAIWLAFAELRRRMKPGESVLVLGAEATGHMFGGFRYVHG